MTTLTRQVSQSSDNAVESGTGVMTLGGSSSTITIPSQWVGHRFQNITIPRGARITSAYTSVYISGIAAQNPDFDIYGQYTDDAPTFTTASSDISSRLRTTNKRTWTAASLGTGFKNSPDLTPVI